MLNVTADTIFTVFVTVLIFALGYIFNKKVENSKEKGRLKDVELYFYGLIEMLEGPLMKQAEGFLKFSKLLKQEKEQHFFLDDVALFQLRLINEIDNKDLFKIFIGDNKGKLTQRIEKYKKMRGLLEYFDVVKKSTGPDLKELTARYDTYVKVYRENLKATSEQFELMLSDNMKNKLLPQHDAFLKEFDEIRFKWSKIDVPGGTYMDMYVARTHYIIRLKDLCIRNVHDPRSVGLMKHVMECIYAINDIDELRTVYRRHYLLFARGLRQGMGTVLEIVASFKLESKDK
jgi:hypothetical protein